MPFILTLLAAAWLCLGGLTCEAALEEFEFVDASGDTGYYVNSKSAYFPVEAPQIVDADIAVKKAGQNRMFAYKMHFDREARTYQILSATVMKYDTKEITERYTEPQAPQNYRSESPMSEIVDYLFAVKR